METLARLLHLLGLLQGGRVLSGPELARDLGVTTRCIRRDVERLRALGYPVDAAPGLGGGYRLAAGRALPPLVLDDAEAVAVAVALRVAAASAVSGIDEPALRALAKLDQILPDRLARQVAIVAETTSVVPGSGPRVEVAVLMAVARCVRDRERLGFGYRRPGAAADQASAAAEMRRTEPARLVVSSGRWYLLAWDLDRDDWRTFRLDRLVDPRGLGTRFAERPVPDAVERVRAGITQDAYPATARILLAASADEVAAAVGPNVAVVEPRGPDACELRAGGYDLRWVLLRVASLGVPFRILEPAWLEEEAGRLGQLLTAASAPTSAGP